MDDLTMKELDVSERESFAAICQQYGFLPADFDVVLSGSVTVSRNGIRQQFPRPTWLRDFDHTARRGGFGTPP